ncbi:MAG: phage tail fiber protein [Methyloligellaceae bacterium]
MSKTDAFENDLLELIFNAVAIANIAEDNTNSPAATLTVSLHTASPGETGDMSTNEAAYTSYARQSVARTGSGWVVAGNSVSPNADIDFPTATGGSETITHVGIGSGTGNNLMYYGAISPTFAVSEGVTPRVTTASTITED